jgi:flagellar hook-associated protein 1 FlgK
MMSLFGILNTATTALLNTQTQIATVSDNVNNSNASNFVARQATLVDTTPASGDTDTVQISRAVNTALQSEVLQQTTSSGGQSFINNIYTQLEQLDGASSGTPILTSAMESFTAAFQALQATPESTTTQNEVIQAGQTLVQAVQTLSNGVEAIATTVTQQAQTDVGNLNSSLSTIANLNNQIVAAANGGHPTAALEDTLDQSLQTVANLVPIQVSFADNGTVQVSTPQGVSLVGVTAANFTYSATTDTIFATNDPNQTALNGSFAGGQIGAELSTLDTSAAGVASSAPGSASLQKIRDQLNSFADQFWAANPPGPETAFQAAYNNAAPTQTGELASDFFTIANPGATPSTDRFGFQVNPALLNGTSTVKQSAASPVAAQLVASTNTFSAGGVSASNATYTGIAEAIASTQTGAAQQVQSAQQSASAALTTTQTTYQNATGVNVNQELAQLIVLQNTFGASSKVISVVEQLLNALQAAVGATTG